MKRFIEGEDQTQITLLPEYLDDYITEDKFIRAVEVWRQLIKMAKQAQAVLETPELQVVADRGYFNGDKILACDDAGITAYVPKPITSEAKAQDRFDKADFVYNPDTDTYRCPAGSQLIRRFAQVEAGHLIHRYWSSDCPHCAIKEKCTPSENHRVSCWEYGASSNRCKGASTVARG